MIEIVNLACQHCAAFAPDADQIAQQVRGEGGTFRVAPVAPTIVQGSTDPAPPVLAVYWLQLHGTDVLAQRGAKAFYRGIQGGADLSSPAGIESWLSLSGVQLPKGQKMDLDDPTLLQHERRALALVARSGIKHYPSILLLDPVDGHFLTALSWSGSAAKLMNQVQDALHSNQSSERAH